MLFTTQKKKWTPASGKVRDYVKFHSMNGLNLHPADPELLLTNRKKDGKSLTGFDWMNPRLRYTDRSCPAIQNKIVTKHLQESQNPPFLSFFFFRFQLTLRREENWKPLWGLLHCTGWVHPSHPSQSHRTDQDVGTTKIFRISPKTEPGSPKLHQEDVHWQSHSHQWVISSSSF